MKPSWRFSIFFWRGTPLVFFNSRGRHLHAASEPSGSQHHEGFVRVSLPAKSELFTGLVQNWDDQIDMKIEKLVILFLET